MISQTYLSTASRSFDEAELQELLAISRRNNDALELTGMLLYADGHFIQTLEGSQSDVEAKMAVIKSDTRHRNIIIALREQISERVFADWSMGFTSLSAAEIAEIPGFSDYLDPGSELYENTKSLGRAGIFHRIFRDNMRIPLT